MPSTSSQSLSEGKTVETDLDRLVGREFSSGKRHTLKLRKESWVPWLTFTNLWNSANAYNLALFSEFVYRKGGEIEDLFSEGLKNKDASESKIKLSGNSLTSGVRWKLLTRNALQENRFKQPEFWNIPETNTQAFAVNSADAVLISIRGTEGFTADGREDWIQNIQASSVPFDEGPEAYWTETGEKLHVHEGFYEAFRSLKDGLTDYLNDHHETEEGENKNVFICGHSLGGAVALLTAAYLTSSWNMLPLLYTYGMPRVGERAFAEHYGPDGKEPLIHHRHVHHQDPVPQVPPPKHEGDVTKLPLQLGFGPAGASALQYNWDSAYTHHGQLTYLPPVTNEEARPILNPAPSDIVSLSEKIQKGVLDVTEEVSILGLFHETRGVETPLHQVADHSMTAYTTVLRRRLDLEINTFLENACGDGAEAKGARIGARDSSGRFQPYTERVNELRDELETLWEKEKDLIAEERQESTAEKRPAYLADDEELQALHQQQEQVKDALQNALEQRAATFPDERSFLIQTPDWPESPCETLKRFQKEK